MVGTVGTFMSWDGANWTLFHPYPGLGLSAVAQDADGELVIIGDHGAILGHLQ